MSALFTVSMAFGQGARGQVEIPESPWDEGAFFPRQVEVAIGV
jgi:hypothetical protein